MAGSNNIDFNFRTKGANKVKQDLTSLASAVDKEAQNLDKKAQARNKKRNGSTAEDGGTKGVGGVVRQAISTAFGQSLSQSLGAANRSIAQAFDPNLSPVEKELNVANAALDLVPFEGGAIPKALLQAQTQEIVGGAKGTGARINSALGPAFQAASGLNDEEFKARFEPIIKQLKDQFEPQERSRERGSQLIAENLGSFLDEFKQVQKDIAPESTSEAIKEQTQSQKELKESMDTLTNTLLGLLGGGGVGGAIAGKVS